MAKSVAVSKTVKPVVKKTVKKSAVAKPVPKKSSKPDPEPYIKYEDKSPGQSHLVPIFETIKAMMVPYAKGDMKLHWGTGGKVLLANHREVVIDGRKKPFMWFISALIQKGYLGFYYMPVYMNKPVEKQLRPELLKCLKGQGCFHIKKADPLIYAQIKEAIKIGFDDYRKKGWI